MPLIALVDDRQTNRNIFSHLAANLDDEVEILAFSNGAAALQGLNSRVPDLVISDYNMPGMNGAEFTRAFRQLPNCADVPVIIITVHGERDWKLMALEAGATDFLSSPVDPVEFTTRGKNLLKLRKHQLQLERQAKRLKGSLASTKAQHLSALRESGARLMQVIDSLPMMISAVDADGSSLFSNMYCRDFSRKSRKSNPSKLERNRLSPLDRAVLVQQAKLEPYEECLQDASGAGRRFLMQKSPLRDSSGHVAGVLTVGFDISQMQGSQTPSVVPSVASPVPADEKILTRHMQMLARRGRRQDLNFAVMAVRLNGFAEVNRLLGETDRSHFPAVALQRLGEELRAHDVLAQLTPDSLAIVQADIESDEDARHLAARLHAIVRDCAALVDHKVQTSAAIGIAIYPAHSDDPLRLLELAKRAATTSSNGAGIGFCSAEMLA